MAAGGGGGGGGGGASDRGWNDPPMFHCEIGLDSRSLPLKTKVQLNKRVAYPSMVAPPKKADHQLVPIKTNPFTAEMASSPPRLHPFLKGGPPKGNPRAIDDVPITCPIPTLPSNPSSSSSQVPNSAILSTTTSSSSSSTTIACPDEPSLTSRRNCLKVVRCFHSLVDDLRSKQTLPEKQLSDVSKKISLLEQQWMSSSSSPSLPHLPHLPHLPPPSGSEPSLDDDVEDKLCKIVEAAEEKRWDRALQIQVALAVDHAGPVKKWVMGLKKLLLACKTECKTESSNSELETQSIESQYFLPVNQ